MLLICLFLLGPAALAQGPKLSVKAIEVSCRLFGKSLLVANLALALAAGQNRAGFTVPASRRVLICQFELPIPQFVSRLAVMRQQIGANADQNLLVDTRATGHLLSAPQGLNHFLLAAREASAEVIVLDPLYSAHDQDENDTRSMAALCQSLIAVARCLEGGADRRAPCAQVHRPG
jgi:RecA-family ATPase